MGSTTPTTPEIARRCFFAAFGGCIVPYKLQVIKSGDFVRLDGRGRVNIYDSQAALRRLAQACVDRGVDHALLDTRDVESTLTITDLFVLASTFGELGFHRGQRLAIIHRMTNEDRAEFFAVCAKNRGWTVGAFDNFEDGFSWLNDAEPI
jgi:hypothetical protein